MAKFQCYILYSTDNMGHNFLYLYCTPWITWNMISNTTLPGKKEELTTLIFGMKQY